MFFSADLSHCQLMQVPDAVYYLMRNTPLVACDLSSNVITKIPPKLPAKFSFIKREYAILCFPAHKFNKVQQKCNNDSSASKAQKDYFGDGPSRVGI